MLAPTLIAIAAAFAASAWAFAVTGTSAEDFYKVVAPVLPMLPAVALLLASVRMTEPVAAAAAADPEPANDSRPVIELAAA
ncbi:hypothetical protein [Magnetospirillum sp. UT-4]|uniref:hypothetical protein n=1 Tax=Magnetospirillum sp. UT-4 TaxID=2681467 RepID=UPI0013805156|nr:hypothetical protein [Magnetospirillum sp. UT-4]CAA7616868.1 exported hypothetical protein [Magnetospirillum sp. UT-4]